MSKSELVICPPRPVLSCVPFLRNVSNIPGSPQPNHTRWGHPWPFITPVQIGPKFLMIISPKCLLTPFPPFHFPSLNLGLGFHISSLNNSSSLLTHLLSFNLNLSPVCYLQFYRGFYFLTPIWTCNSPNNEHWMAFRFLQDKMERSHRGLWSPIPDNLSHFFPWLSLPSGITSHFWATFLDCCSPRLSS